MKYVFGPVLSRRLGQSLGVDPIPLKTCNWSCVYCQLGRTTPFTSTPREYAPVSAILDEVKQVLERDSSLKIDWISIVGSGEPLLHTGIGQMIDGIKSLTQIPVALITNGSLLFYEDVRNLALDADTVCPTLDAGSEEIFGKINRPHPGVKYNQFISGLIEFRKVYNKKLWPEVMLIKDLNDSEEQLNDVADKLKLIGADEVYINVPARIPAEDWVKSPDSERVAYAKRLFEKICPVTSSREGAFLLNRCEKLPDAILHTVSRHPLSQKDIEDNLRDWTSDQIKEALELLKANDRVQCVERSGLTYWTPKGSSYSG